MNTTHPTCHRDGCNDPRHVTSSGNILPYCQPHMREVWRKKKIPTPGKKRGPEKGWKQKQVAQQVEPEPTPQPAPKAESPTSPLPEVPKRGGQVFDDPVTQIVILREGYYAVYEVAMVKVRAFDKGRTPENVKRFYEEHKAIAVIKAEALP